MSSSTRLDDNFGERWVTTLRESFVETTDALGDLDRRAGDGDFGTNIATALRLTTQNVEESDPNSYTQWLTALSRGFLGVGGTSGPLFGMFFRELAKCSSAGAPTVAELAAGLTAGVATVQRYGKAEVGHKTMVDAIAPAAEALQAHVEAGADAATALQACAQAAIDGAKSTESILAKRGRASYVGEVARGVLDPGAAAAALMLQAAALAAGNDGSRVDASWITASAP